MPRASAGSSSRLRSRFQRTGGASDSLSAYCSAARQSSGRKKVGASTLGSARKARVASACESSDGRRTPSTTTMPAPVAAASPADLRRGNGEIGRLRATRPPAPGSHPRPPARLASPERRREPPPARPGVARGTVHRRGRASRSAPHLVVQLLVLSRHRLRAEARPQREPVLPRPAPLPERGRRAASARPGQARGASSGGTSRPVSPSAIASETLPTSVATTGRLASIASTRASGRPSLRLARTYTSRTGK